MKIFHVAGGGDRGGAKTHILALCSRLMERFDLTLVSLRSGDFPESAEQAGIRTRTFFSWFVPYDYYRLIKLVREEKPDIVHCHGAKANVAGLLVKLFCRTTVISTVHSDYQLDYMNNALKRWTIGLLNGGALRFIDYYVTVSELFKNMLIERNFDPHKCMSIYNGLDFDEKATPFDKTEWLRNSGIDYEEGDVVLGILARLTPVKDIPTLLRAFAKAREGNPRLKLLIGGDGEDADKLKSLAKQLGLGKSVSFMGWVTDVSHFFASCDIDVLCSVSESFPYSILEGIREGCAVITSDVGGMRRLIDQGESGYIFQPKDVDTFAQHILELSLDADKRQRFATNLYEKASRLYSLDSMADTQSRIYADIMHLESLPKRCEVLICGAYGKGNSGDEAILRSIITSMRSIDPLIPLTVMTRKPEETRLLYGVRAIYTFNVPRFLYSAKRTKLFINGGGSLIQDSTSSRSLYYYLFTIWAAKLRGAKVLMYGCGIGHVARSFNRKISRIVLDHNADIITLRDAISRKELLEMGITKPDVRDSADPAMSLSPVSDEEACAYLRKHGLDPDGNYICFSLRPWKDFNDYAAFAEAADYAKERYGMTTVFMPIENPTDLAPSQETASLMHNGSFLLPAPQQVELTMAVLRRMHMVCAMRLHALVFSAAANTPFIAVSYDIKVQSFMEYVNNPSCCDLYDVNGAFLRQQIDRVMAQPEAYRDNAARLRAMEAQNNLAAREILGIPASSNE
ncbi:MAG: polysaccharide pyruvyl transferase CsaB [Clostridia bacterium]|nr:polysaccharide pyruvyl transferase CsaB [Clostridia bacterium]